MLERNWDQFVAQSLPRRFFMLPFVAEVKCEYPSKPQWVAPAKKGPGNPVPGNNAGGGGPVKEEKKGDAKGDADANKGKDD